MKAQYILDTETNVEILDFENYRLKPNGNFNCIRVNDMRTLAKKQRLLSDDTISTISAVRKYRKEEKKQFEKKT